MEIELLWIHERTCNLYFSKIWVLSGNDGKPVSGWPFRVGKSHSALPLVTQLDGQGALDIVSTLFSRAVSCEVKKFQNQYVFQDTEQL